MTSMPSRLRQPRAVWAVAFACVIAFMGIGLVDPILAHRRPARTPAPSQVSLLFTSYMAVMGVAMLLTGFVSSRIGAKRTLLTGLALIVVFAALAGLCGTVGADRRLPRRLGARQRALHRHRAGHHRVRSLRLDRPGASSSSKPPWAWASRPGRSSADSWARSRGEPPSSGWPS